MMAGDKAEVSARDLVRRIGLGPMDISFNRRRPGRHVGIGIGIGTAFDFDNDTDTDTDGLLHTRGMPLPESFQLPDQTSPGPLPAQQQRDREHQDRESQDRPMPPARKRRHALTRL